MMYLSHRRWIIPARIVSENQQIINDYTTCFVRFGCMWWQFNIDVTSGNQQGLTITTFGELATLDSADYDDVPSSDMLGQILKDYIVTKDNKVELGMAARRANCECGRPCIRLNYVMQMV